MAARSYSAADLTLELLGPRKGRTVAAVLPARGVAETLPAILDVVIGLSDVGFLDEVVVVASPQDPSFDLALERGVHVIDETKPFRGAGPAEGKGDALWRAAGEVSSEIVVAVDTDTLNFGPHFLTGLTGPLLIDERISFVKGAFDRPLALGDLVLDEEGGRVTEMVARPLLNIFFPELSGFVQPLAGEIAIRTKLLRDISIPVGYGLEIAMLIDVHEKVGLPGMSQVDLGERRDSNRTLRDLVPMAHACAAAVLQRAERYGRPARFDWLVRPEGQLLQRKATRNRERQPLGEWT